MGGEECKLGERSAFEVLIEEWHSLPVIALKHLCEFKKLLHEFISD